VSGGDFAGARLRRRERRPRAGLEAGGVGAVVLAAVARSLIAVVALLGAFDLAVAARLGDGRLGAVRLAAVSGDAVAVVALLAFLLHPVAADGPRMALIGAAVEGVLVAVVAAFAGFDLSIAAHRR